MEIIPYVGVGDIRFGMSVSEVRRVMGYSPVCFRKTPQALHDVDAFEHDKMHVYYRCPGICQAVEFFPMADVSYKSEAFFGKPFSLVSSWIYALDPGAKVDRSGLTSFLLGIALYGPAVKAPKEPIETLLVFEKGYYEAD